MQGVYESSNEHSHIEKDLVDRVRHEISWEINRYVRRMKDDAIAHARKELSLRGHANVDLKQLASEAVREASGGMFINDPQKVLDA